MSKTFLILGATGFIGQVLCARLEEAGQQVWALSRNLEAARKTLGEGPKIFDDLDDLPPDPFDAVINLAGAPIADKAWSEGRKAILSASRVGLTQRLVQTLAQREHKPAVLVQGSAIGFYPFEGDETFDEESPPGQGFLAQLCQAWEAEALAAKNLGLRVCLARTGLVLGAGGGALEKMLPPFKWGLGGKLGNGRQWMSWIHRQDHVSALLRLAEDPELEGPFNLTSPEPVRNTEFTKTLGRVLNRPTPFGVPKFALKLALGERAQLLLGSQKVLPRALSDVGFPFQYRTLQAALENILITDV